VTWLDRSAMQRLPTRQATPKSRARLPEPDVAADFTATTLDHAGALYRLAYHLAGNAAEAEDLTQETYLRAYRGYTGFRGGDVRAWLFTILRHVFIDECRRHRRMPTILSADDDARRITPQDVATSAPSAETEALRRLPSEAVERAFAALPPDWRLVVLLADVEELSYREIADIMEIPLGTVMSRLHRARKQLQQRLLDDRQRGRNQHERSA
jgi:RNA polymerase sigma-70 factor (ECF subfamily)